MPSDFSEPNIREYYSKNEFTSLKMSEIFPFNDHPFKLYKDERMDDLKASIEKSGLINPIIVRTTDTEHRYEIISGHNRYQAFKDLGKKEIPAIILKDMSDEMALAYVIESNVLQRSFSEMSHSEKAAVLAQHHSKLFSQGKRDMIKEEIIRLNSVEPDEAKWSATFHQSGKKYRSNELVAEKYSLSPAQVSRYLRINKLIKQLKYMLDEDFIGFTPAVELSFLSAPIQEEVAHYMGIKGIPIDGRKAKMLKAFYLAGELKPGGDITERILSGTLIPKPPRKSPKNPITISPAVYEKYFSPKHKPEEIEETIAAALDAYFNKEVPHESHR